MFLDDEATYSGAACTCAAGVACADEVYGDHLGHAGRGRRDCRDIFYELGAFDDTAVDGRARASVLVDSTCEAAPLCIIPSEPTRVTGQPLARTRKHNCKWMGARERYEHGLRTRRVTHPRELGSSRSVRCAGGNYGPCLQGCQGSIYQILCAFIRAGASNGQMAEASPACPI